MKTKANKPNKYVARMGSFVSEPGSSFPVEAFVERFHARGESLESLAQRLGVAEITRRRLPFEGAVSIDSNQRVVITINSLSHPLRQRFTLAHEIGHLMLWGMLQENVQCGVDRDLERASDAIAAELLLPKQGVLSYARTLDGPSPGNLRLVARTFEVSLQSAALRLCSDLRIWSRSFGLWEYGDRGSQSFRASEPTDPSVPRESWFVGKRRWQTKRPPFRVFSEALNSSAAVHAHESYLEDGVMKPISLEVLHLGRGRLLATVH
jgi:IrrE N-terminal-like domain